MTDCPHSGTEALLPRTSVSIERKTLLILYKTKRLVWDDNMFCVPEQLMDSDIVAMERNVSLGESP